MCQRPGTLHLIAAAFVGIAISAWLLLVARDQYFVAALQPYPFLLDAVFLFGVAGALVTSAAAMYGTRSVLIRCALASVSLIVGIVSAEGVARFVFRHAH